MYQETIQWLAAHQAVMVAFAIAAINMAIKFALWLHPIPDWVAIFERNPRVAALVRLMNAIGINPVSVVQSFVDFILARSSASTKSEIHAITVSAGAITELPSPPGPVAPKALRCDACKVTWVPGPDALLGCPVCTKAATKAPN